MREMLARLRDRLRRDRLDAELAEELRFHRALLERDARAAGLPPDRAADAARRRLGNVTRAREESRDRWSIPSLDRLQQDLRYAIRGLRRAPGFTAAVVLTLGLGIGANAAMFGIVDRLMFRPVPHLRDPGTVDRVYLATRGWNRDEPYTVFPYARFLDLQAATRSFAQHAAFASATHGVGTGAGGRERTVLAVSAGFFDFFDVRPVSGRLFDAADDADDPDRSADVAVLGFDYWRTERGGRDVLGERIQVGTAAYTIIGVAPPGFVGVDDGEPPAVVVPIGAYAAHEGAESGVDVRRTYSWDWAQMIVRRRPGVDRDAATADLTRAFLRSWDASRLVHPGYRSAELARPRAIAGPVRTAAGPTAGLEARTLLWVSGVAAIVLLIACANVANLLLARALQRRREVALRVALGVSRRRLAAQTLVETLLLSLLGCAAGILVAQWGGAALRRAVVPHDAAANVLTDWRTLAVAVAAALVATLATGLAPMLLARRQDLVAVLKSGGRGGSPGRSRTRSALLIIQAALSFVLLVGAALFARSLANVHDLPLGYDIDRLLLVTWEPRGTPLDSASRAGLADRVLVAAAGIPDVEHGAWTTSVPFGRGTTTMGLAVPGVDSVGRLGRFAFQSVSSDYFATVGTRLLRGRPLGPTDGPGAPPAVVVSRSMAERLWPGGDALGRCVRVAWRGSPDSMPCTTVVGVAEDAMHDPVADVPMRYYLPDAQLGMGASTLLLRMRRDPAVAAEEVRRALQAVMPGQALVAARPARTLLDTKRRSWLLGATMFVALGGLALVVAAVGLYGVIAYDVAQRMHELGVRVALGASAGDVVRIVVGRGMRLAATGLVAGALLAVAAARWIEPLLFRQSAGDPAIFALVGSVMAGVALVACLAPAVRAMRADPNTVLRTE